MGPEPARTEERNDRVLAPTRWVSIGIVPVLCAAFVILFIFPTRTKELWAWTIHPTMTAMMMGGGYLAGAWFFFRAATTTEGHRVLKGLLGTTVFTTLLLGATLLHWEKFNHGHVSFWAWMSLYVLTPPLLPWLWFNNRRTDPGTTGAGDVVVPDPVRAVVTAIGVGQLLFAVVLFVRPSLFISHWPWMLTPLTARVIAAFVAFPAVTWALFATDRRWSSFEIPMETATIGLALVLIATIRAADEFDGKAPVYAALLVATLAALITLQLMMRRRVPG